MNSQTEHQYAYNYIFQDIVEDAEDVLGMVAYTIYKRHKIDWLQDHKAKHGREPTPEELETFNSVSKQGSDGYKAEAQEVLQQFMATALNDLAQNISNDLNTQYDEEIKKLDARIAAGTGSVLTKHNEAIRAHLDTHKHGFWHGVWEHSVAALVYTILAGLMFFGLSAYYKDSAASRVKDAILSPPAANGSGKTDTPH